MAKTLSNTTIRALLGPVSSTIIDRGRSYFKSGAVNYIELHDDIAFATVMGSEEYEVTIALEPSAADENDCTCPYFDQYGACKHQVAALFEAHAEDAIGGSAGNDLIESLTHELRVMLGNTVTSIHRPKAKSSNNVQTKPTAKWRERLAEIASHKPLYDSDLLPEGAEMFTSSPPSRTDPPST